MDYGIFDDFSFIDDWSMQKKVLTLTNGINTKSDLDSSRQTNGSLSLTDLEVIANMKDANKKNGVIDTPEIGFVKVPSRHNNMNGRLTNNDNTTSSKKSSKNNVKKAVIEVIEPDEKEISDSESSTTSSSRTSDNSPKTSARNNAKCESLQTKVKEEQQLR